MLKTDFIKLLAMRAEETTDNRITQTNAEFWLEHILNNIEEVLINEGSFRLGNICKLYLQRSPSREYTNPQTGEKFFAEGTLKVKARTSAHMKERFSSKTTDE